MVALLTAQEMAIWTQTDLPVIAADPFAKQVNQEVGKLLLFLAGHPEWTPATVPPDVKNIAVWMCKRTYTNPDQETSSNTGPIGSRVLDVAAMAMELTDSEAAVLQRYKNASGGGSGLFLLSLASGRPRTDTTVYVSDDQQINIDSTNAAPSWDVPWTTGDDVNQPVEP